MITPLRKKNSEGGGYTRPHKIESKISELMFISEDELISRCEIRLREDLGYVPSECLLYFVRARRTSAFGERDVTFRKLYNVLIERVRNCLPKGENVDGKTEFLTESNIRDQALGKFIELLFSDRISYEERLDFYEIRFDRALLSLRLDAQKLAWKEAKRSITIHNDGTGELRTEVGQAIESLGFVDSDYRLSLDAAIDALPPEQRQVVEMMLEDIPFDSKDPNTITIAKVLGRSEKTIRNYRDKAFVTLRTSLGEGGQL